MAHVRGSSNDFKTNYEARSSPEVHCNASLSPGPYSALAGTKGLGHPVDSPWSGSLLQWESQGTGQHIWSRAGEENYGIQGPWVWALAVNSGRIEVASARSKKPRLIPPASSQGVAVKAGHQLGPAGNSPIWGQWEEGTGRMFGLSRKEGVFPPNHHLSGLEILALHRLLHLTPGISSVLGSGDIQR